MTRSLLVLASLIMVLAASPAAAQNPWFDPRGVGVWSAWPNGGWGVYNGYGSYGGAFGNAAAWPQAGQHLHGIADVVRAQGAYNARTSRGMVDYEVARSRYLANKQAWVDIYFSIREENQARRAAKLAAAKHSPEALAAAARPREPRRLTTESLDRLTGEIHWPELLLADHFAPARITVEQFLVARTATSGYGLDDSAAQAAVQELVNLLRDDVRDVPTTEYIDARHFLESLAAEVRS